jgi:filamentous hemagglutinin family protein
MLALSMIFSPALVAAAPPTIPGFYGSFSVPAPIAGTLPVPRSGTFAGATIETSGVGQMNIIQNQGQGNVTIDWSSFNIAAGSSVRFYQGSGTPGAADWKPNRDYAALNRIYDSNPSQIYGRLQADGKIYLINRNGILFGPGSQVNVHSLAASALNITQDNFNKGLLRFTSAADSNQAAALDDTVTIANHGTITTDSGGSVSLIGPRVENAGSIISPSGNVNMIGVRLPAGGTLAEEDLALTTSFDPGVANVIYNSQATPGVAVNFSNGFIGADSGRIGIYGNTVQQGGVIRSVSAVKKGGEIFLKAKSQIITDPGSVTESPVSASGDKVNQTFVYNGGTIQLGGLTVADSFVSGDDGSFARKETASHAIEHHGSLSAPSGQVTLNAIDKIFMDTGSSIDVAGKWVDLPASANLVSSTLNSVELRDFYVQKYGALKGEKIWFDLLNSSTIGDISGAYTVEEKTALERSTRGGVINLSSSGIGQIISKNGSLLSFSGGGFRYAPGSNTVSMVVAGNKIFDIGSAPQSFSYRLLDTQTKTYSRFGVTETFHGMFYGGSSSVNSYSIGRIAGSDAGSLSLVAGLVRLDGAILGDVTRGIYQTKSTPHNGLDPNDTLNKDYLANLARGIESPLGGTLSIGQDPGPVVGGLNLFSDSVVQEIVVRPFTASLSAEFGANDQLSNKRTELSASLLSGAGLSKLNLFSNTTLDITPGSRITLVSGGSFVAKARRIEHGGEVIVPGGNATFILQDNLTAIPKVDGSDNPSYIPITSNLYFAPGSLVSVRGETIDNTGVNIFSSGEVRSGVLNGGNIFIKDLTVDGTLSGNNLVIAKGATLDVSGGYLVDNKGKVTGGDAGSLDLRSMNMSLAGDLRGFALLGKKGGEITLHSGEIVVGISGAVLPEDSPPDASPPEVLKGKLLLSQDRFTDTGFTRMNLIAANNITFDNGVELKPSTSRISFRKTPIIENMRLSQDVYSNPDYIGNTSFSANAGTLIYNSTLFDGLTPIFPNLNAKILVGKDASIKTAGGGTISLNAPEVDVAGILSSPGGNVSITARVSDVTLLEGARILVNGYNKQDASSLFGNKSSYVPQAAGTVSLISNSGSINMNPGSLLDLSGSAPADQFLRNTGSAPELLVASGNPGRLKLSYGTTLSLNGDISAHAQSTGLIGGALTLNFTPSEIKALEISIADLEYYKASGFDAFTYVSTNSIKLPDVGEISIGRNLILDAPIISGNPASQTRLQAPWIKLMNSTNIEILNPGQVRETGGGQLTFSSNALDINGNLQISGVQDVKLESLRDITFSDHINSANNGWIGNLWTTGNITLQAQRIYPTTASQYTITSNGRVSILPQGSIPPDTASIYSAGGSLSIKAPNGIDHQGLLAAPMGSISLDGMGSRVYLSENSSIITSGTVPVSYGNFDGTTWSAKTINGRGGTLVQAAPGKAINITGSEVIIREGATVDSSGGGSVYTALWQPGLEGSVNPFTLSSRYVIMPDNSVTLPGRAIHLEAVPELGLKAGVYSILPADFAFLPGALIIQDTGTTLATGSSTRSAQGYTLIGGYATVTDTAVSSPVYEGYTVRRATDVQKEGNFTIKQFAASDGGAITVSASDSAVMAGSLKGSPLSGGQGAVFSLSGANVQVKDVVAALDNGFDFNTPIPSSLAGTMQLQANSVSNKGLKGLILGDGGTNTVTIQKGSVLQVPEITLNAKTGVTVESGAKVLGTGDGGSGTVTVNAPAGTFTLQDTSVLRASHGLTLNASNIVLNGDLKVDSGSLNLTAQNIFFVPDTYQQSTAGLYLSENLWKSFSQYQDLTLKSSNDMVFLRDVNLAAAGSLTIDAGRLVNQTSQANVNIQARTLSILNSGTTLLPTQALTGQLSLGADRITVSSKYAAGSKQGGVLFDGFDTVNMTSTGDLILQGGGAMATAGSLKLTASRLTATYVPDSTGAFLAAADFKITSGGAFSYVSANGTPGMSGVPGGNLAIQGSSLRINGLIDMPSGNVTLAAAGSGATDGVYLDAKARILAQGAVVQTADPKTTISTPAGRVSLSASAGPVEITAGAVVDVSAVKGSDAGSLALSAPGGEVTVAGELRGKPVDGRGASFDINSGDLAGVGGLDALSASLAAGGFNERLTIHSRNGDLTLAAASKLTGREVVVATDGGAIDLYGAINADGRKAGDAGGRVELYAKTTLTLENGASISAKGMDGSTGGSVSLNSLATDKLAGNYALQVNSGSTINVTGSGTGGTVSFRAYELPGGIDANMAPLAAGTITGASRVSVEEAKKFSVNGNIGAFNAPYNSFMSNANMADLKSRLFANVSAADLAKYHLQAGIELVSDPGKDLVLNTAWDLTSVRPGGEAGILSLRAAGNLDIAKNLVDHPNASFTTLHGDTMLSSWGFNLVAGADLNGASPLAVTKGRGNLVLGLMDVATGRLTVDKIDNATSGSLVYTENAAINFASGNNTDIGYGVPAGYMINSTMRYNIGSYGGRVVGETGGDLTIRAGAIQTAVGDIDLRVGGDLDLLNRRDGSFSIPGSFYPNSTGSIRTTGEFTPGTTKSGPDLGSRTSSVSTYWTYSGGGDILLDVGGIVSGQINNVVVSQDAVAGNSNAWDTASGGSVGTNKYLTANYTATDSTEGIATMAGGSVNVRSGKGFISQIGTFGTGDLTIVSGGDVTGRYRNTKGTGNILAMGTMGAISQVFEIADSQIRVASMGDINIAAILNPNNTRSGVSLGNSVWDLTYSYKGKQSGSQDTSISLISLLGSAALSGNSLFDGYKTSGGFQKRQQILPPVTEIITAGDLKINGQFALAPSPSGNLRLIAGGNIINTTNSFLSMVDVNLVKSSLTYPYQRISNSVYANSTLFSLFTRTGDNLLHQGDPSVIEIRSGKDINSLQLIIDKAANIQADRDITELVFSGQNLSPDDVTNISAGRDVVYSFSVNQPSTALEMIGPGIKLGGPGMLIVQAGRNISLGNSTGIQSVGGFINPSLGETGSGLIVVAGAKQYNLLPSEVAAFFYGVDGRSDHADLSQNGLIKGGDDYSQLKNSGNLDAAKIKLDDVRNLLIRPMIDVPIDSSDGYISMASSQINSLASKSDIFMMSRGSIDVGKSSLDSSSSQQPTGISTASGGKINIYAGEDVNVNESRIMSYLGGDISIWVDQGNLNAGRGSRTSISPSPPRKSYDSASKSFVTTFTPPAVGSGIRAVTFDPNTAPGGPLPIPEAGNINIYVPNGKIDAGEAGIVTTNKLTLAATQVLNVKSISGGNGSSGFSAAGDSSVSLGALGGNSNLTDSSRMAETATTGSLSRENAQNKMAQAADDFLSKYLDVRVISFDTDAPADVKDSIDELTGKKKKK